MGSPGSSRRIVSSDDRLNDWMSTWPRSAAGSRRP